MRSAILNHYPPGAVTSLKLWFIRKFLGTEAEDPGRAAFYKPHLFSKSYYRLQHQVLHQKSVWSKQQREYFAAISAARIKCEFCKVTHSAFAQPPSALSANNDSKNLHEMADTRIRTLRLFLEKLTEMPWDISPEDLRSLHREKISLKEMEDAVMCCVVMNIGARLSAALNFRILSSRSLKRSKAILMAFGYRIFFL